MSKYELENNILMSTPNQNLVNSISTQNSSSEQTRPETQQNESIDNIRGLMDTSPEKIY